MSGVFTDMPAYQLWLLAGLVLAIAEVVIPGVYLFWIGAAALATGAVTFLFAMDSGIQFGAFALFILAALYGGRLAYNRNPVASSDPLLNDRSARLVGRHVIVSEAITNGLGRVNVDDGSWRASGPDAPVGTKMTVTAAGGMVLTVEPLDQ